MVAINDTQQVGMKLLFYPKVGEVELWTQEKRFESGQNLIPLKVEMHRDDAAEALAKFAAVFKKMTDKKGLDFDVEMIHFLESILNKTMVSSFSRLQLRDIHIRITKNCNLNYQFRIKDSYIQALDETDHDMSITE